MFLSLCFRLSEFNLPCLPFLSFFLYFVPTHGAQFAVTKSSLRHSFFADSHWSSCRRAYCPRDRCSSIGKAAGARLHTSNAIHGGGNIIRQMVHNSLLQNHHSDILSLPTRIGQAADGHLARSTVAQALVKLQARVSIPRMPFLRSVSAPSGIRPMRAPR